MNADHHDSLAGGHHSLPRGYVLLIPPCRGYFGHAESVAERGLALGAAVDGARVKDEILALLPVLADGCADEAGTDAAALMIGVDFDKRVRSARSA